MKTSILLLVVSLLAGDLTVAVMACNTVTPADQQAIAFDAIRIGVCQEKGRECKRVDGGDCWNVYDACISDAGLRGDR